MRWLLFFLLLALPVGSRPPRVRLLYWNLACPGGEPWEQEDRLQRAARTLRPLKAEIVVLLDGPDPGRLAAAAGYPTMLCERGIVLLSRLPMRGYRTFSQGLEVHYDQPFPFAVLAARGDPWQRAWELRKVYPGRGVAALGAFDGWEGMRAPIAGIALDPLLLRRLQPKTVKARTLKVSPHPLVRLDLR